MDLASLQTTVARISARLNENLSETARDLGLQGLDPASLAGVGAAGRYLEDGTVVSQDGVRETKRLLESRREASMAEGLRRVLAMMLRGLPVVTFFPQVVQCLSSSTSSNTTSSASAIQIRSLVSLYILRQAAFEPDLALLAVNMYQKDLRDPNPVIRALAIRTLAGMELDSIVTLVLMSLKTASRDTNWLVRRTVAEALDRVFVLDPSHLTSLVPILETGLADQNPLVTGSSLAAFESICPERLELLHPHYRRYCKSLVDADEWTQITQLRVLEQYARQQFPNPEGAKKIDPDLRLLLQCTEPLLWNRNPAVVLSAVRITYRLSPSSFSQRHAAALGRLLQAPPEIQGAVLAAIALIASEKPTHFSQHLRQFYVYQLSDNLTNKLLKLQILILLSDESNIATILAEFTAYTRMLDAAFTQQVVSGIGQCAAKVPKVRVACLKSLMDLLGRYDEDSLTACLLHEITQIIAAPDLSSAVSKKAIAELLLRHTQNRFNSPMSKAEFYNAMSRACHLFGDLLPNVLDVVRRGAKGFTNELDSGKCSLLRLSSKLLVLCQKGPSPALLKTASSLHTYLLTLGRYDPSWSVRACARMHSGIATVIKAPLASEDDSEVQRLEQDAFASGEAISIAPSAPTTTQEPKESSAVSAVQAAVLGGGSANAPTRPQSSYLMDFERLAGWPKLPAWLPNPPQHSLRDAEVEAASFGTKAYRGFGSTPTASAGASRKTSSGHSPHTMSKRKFEKVVLVPTDTYTPPAAEKPRATNLQAFLESSEDDADDGTDSESEAETTNDDTESDGSSGSQAERAPKDVKEQGSSQEESSSGLEDSEDEEDATAPLVA